MTSFMRCFVANACESCVTESTFMRLFTSVDVDVIAESTGFTEAFATIVTFVLFLTGRHVFLHHVVIEFAFADHFTAHRTGNFNMDLKIISKIIHTVRNLHFLSKNSTLISRENCRFLGG